MKAMVSANYGLDNLFLEDIETPAIDENEVLVKVEASSITTHNLLMVVGKPLWIRPMVGKPLKPKHKIFGSDFAGRIIAVGKNVTQFKKDDKVFGDSSNYGFGAYASYIAVSEKIPALMPENCSFEHAAGMPQAALVALQGLRDKGNIQAGQKVLIYGASGGIGTFAVQFAKYFGTEVTAVCSSKNHQLVKSIGADHVIDYNKEDFSNNGKQYDLIFAVATCSINAHLRALRPQGTYVSVGAPSISRIYEDMVVGPGKFKRAGKKLVGGWTFKQNQEDLIFVKKLVEEGNIKPVIDKVYPLIDLADAFRYFSEGHSTGKVIVSV